MPDSKICKLCLRIRVSYLSKKYTKFEEGWGKGRRAKRRKPSAER